MLKKQKRYLYLDDEEISVMLQSLIRLKNTLIREGRYTDCVDELIVKVMEAPTRKIKITESKLRLAVYSEKSRRLFFIPVHSRLSCTKASQAAKSM